MRRGRAGLGYVHPILERRNLHDKKTWDQTGHPAKYLQLFSWNAGSLQRSSLGDMLNDLLASQYHISGLQEAEGMLWTNTAVGISWHSERRQPQPRHHDQRRRHRTEGHQAMPQLR